MQHTNLMLSEFSRSIRLVQTYSLNVNDILFFWQIFLFTRTQLRLPVSGRGHLPFLPSLSLPLSFLPWACSLHLTILLPWNRVHSNLSKFHLTSMESSIEIKWLHRPLPDIHVSAKCSLHCYFISAIGLKRVFTKINLNSMNFRLLQ